MPTTKLLLHQATKAQLKGLLHRTRGSYLFAGASSLGKFTVARHIVKQLNCLGNGDDGCTICRLIDSGNFPNLIVVQPLDKPSIGISQIQELQHALSLSSDTGRRVVIIKAADKLTDEAQNCLLKTLEEPPPGTVIILLVEQTMSLLETVKSRCQAVYFLPLSPQQISEHLIAGLSLTPDQASEIAELADGAIGLAYRLAGDPELLGRYRQLTQLVSQIEKAGLFDRLLMATKLSEANQDLTPLVKSLVNHERGRQRQANYYSEQDWLHASERLNSIAEYELQLGSNVSLKTALSGLLLKW